MLSPQLKLGLILLFWYNGESERNVESTKFSTVNSHEAKNPQNFSNLYSEESTKLIIAKMKNQHNSKNPQKFYCPN